MPKQLKLNTTQLAAMRAIGSGRRLRADHSTLRALVARGFATEYHDRRGFVLTAAGRRRAMFAADVKGARAGIMIGDSLMRDLP